MERGSTEHSNGSDPSNEFVSRHEAIYGKELQLIEILPRAEFQSISTRVSARELVITLQINNDWQFLLEPDGTVVLSQHPQFCTINTV